MTHGRPANTDHEYSNGDDRSDKVAVALIDVDGTLLPGALSLDFASAIAEAGIGSIEKFAALFELMNSYRDGTLDHEQVATRGYEIYGSAIAGVRERDLDELAVEVWERRRSSLYPYVEKLFPLLEQGGIVPVLISGCQYELLANVARDYNVSLYFGSRYECRSGQYTGRPLRMPGTRHGKAQAIRQLEDELSIDWGSSLALGDSVADLALFERVGRPLWVSGDAALPGQSEMYMVKEFALQPRTHAQVLDALRFHPLTQQT